VWRERARAREREHAHTREGKRASRCVSQSLWVAGCARGERVSERERESLPRERQGERPFHFVCEWHWVVGKGTTRERETSRGRERALHKSVRVRARVARMNNSQTSRHKYGNQETDAHTHNHPHVQASTRTHKLTTNHPPTHTPSRSRSASLKIGFGLSTRSSFINARSIYLCCVSVR
jgi:hypothetical protein